MIDSELRALLHRLADWPADRQRQLVEIARDIEAEMSGRAYHASAEELAAIDEGRSAETATPEEVEAAFASFRRQ